MRRVAVIIALSALPGMFGGGVTAAPALAGGAGSGNPAFAVSALPRAAADSIHWGKCANPSLQQAHAQCALLPVPPDCRDPAGPQIKIAVSRIRHTSKNYQGVLATNIGGPGASGWGFPEFLIGQLKAEHLGAAASGYDWIGFDTRGVGSSLPAITCDPNYFSPDRRNYNPADQIDPALLAGTHGRLRSRLHRARRGADHAAAPHHHR